ncbi:hypothetical protein MHU86_2400 [Fragilaria crotonensis]|nr:hypothetical protein MHU86_2400 [Fragilaria crotonensis]
MLPPDFLMGDNKRTVPLDYRAAAYQQLLLRANSAKKDGRHYVDGCHHYELPESCWIVDPATTHFVDIVVGIDTTVGGTRDPQGEDCDTLLCFCSLIVVDNGVGKYCHWGWIKSDKGRTIGIAGRTRSRCWTTTSESSCWLVEVEQRQELHDCQRQRILLLPLILQAEQRLMHEGGVMVLMRCVRPVVKEGGAGIPTSHPTQEHVQRRHEPQEKMRGIVLSRQTLGRKQQRVEEVVVLVECPLANWLLLRSSAGPLRALTLTGQQDQQELWDVEETLSRQTLEHVRSKFTSFRRLVFHEFWIIIDQVIT